MEAPSFFISSRVDKYKTLLQVVWMSLANRACFIIELSFIGTDSIRFSLAHQSDYSLFIDMNIKFFQVFMNISMPINAIGLFIGLCDVYK